MAKRSRKKAQFTGNYASSIKLNCNMQAECRVLRDGRLFQE